MNRTVFDSLGVPKIAPATPSNDYLTDSEDITPDQKAVNDHKDDMINVYREKSLDELVKLLEKYYDQDAQYDDYDIPSEKIMRNIITEKKEELKGHIDIKEVKGSFDKDKPKDLIMIESPYAIHKYWLDEEIDTPEQKATTSTKINTLIPSQLFRINFDEEEEVLESLYNQILNVEKEELKGHIHEKKLESRIDEDDHVIAETIESLPASPSAVSKYWPDDEANTPEQKATTLRKTNSLIPSQLFGIKFNEVENTLEEPSNQISNIDFEELKQHINDEKVVGHVDKVESENDVIAESIMSLPASLPVVYWFDNEADILKQKAITSAKIDTLVTSQLSSATYPDKGELEELRLQILS